MYISPTESVLKLELHICILQLKILVSIISAVLDVRHQHTEAIDHLKQPHCSPLRFHHLTLRYTMRIYARNVRLR